jgi:hypothetical protein
MDKPDYMSVEEYEDLEKMKAEVIKLKLSTYDYLTSVQAYDSTALLHSGYRNMTNAQAMEKILCEANVKIAKMHQAHIKKYPD